MTDDTRKPVSELSGRELDAAVAEEVLGRVVVVAPVRGGQAITREVWGETMEGASTRLHQAYSEHDGLREPYFDGPNYSTLIGAAWEVFVEVNDLKLVEKLSDRGFLVGDHGYHGIVPPCSRADTAPEAICRAALKAVRSDA